MIYYTKDILGSGMSRPETKVCLPTNILSVSKGGLTYKQFTFIASSPEDLKKIHSLIEHNNELCKELFVEYLENGEENIDRIRVLNYQIYSTSKQIFSSNCGYV